MKRLSEELSKILDEFLEHAITSGRVKVIDEKDYDENNLQHLYGNNTYFEITPREASK